MAVAELTNRDVLCCSAIQSRSYPWFSTVCAKRTIESIASFIVCPSRTGARFKTDKAHEYLSTYILLSTIYKHENNLLISIKTLIPLLILYTLHYRNDILRLHRDLLLSSLLFHLHLSHLLRVTYDRGNID